MADIGLIYIYVMLIFFVMMLVNYFIIRSKKRAIKEVKCLRNVTIWAGMCMLVNIVIALNDRIGIAYPLFSLYFAGIDILLVSFVKYMTVYTSSEDSAFIVGFSRVVAGLAGLDVLSLLLNTLTRHAFELDMLANSYGQVYFVCKGKLSYDLHLYFDYFLIVVMFVVLIRKATKVARIYRLRYLSYVIILAVLVVANIVYMFFELKNDWSVCLYGLFIVIASNISSIYTVDKLKHVMLHQIIDGMDDGILIFDENGDNIYANEIAMKILETENMENVTDSDALKKYFEDGDISDDGITLKKDEINGRYYKVFIEKIAEPGGMSVGSFYIMRDVTQSMRMIKAEKEKNETDALTGLMSKEYFYDMAADVLKKNPNTGYLIICTNFENFRMLNRIFGRKKGDEILAETADILSRTSDYGLYGRVGSDCFSVLLPIESYNEKMFMAFMGRVEKLIERGHYTMNIMVGVYEVKDTSVPVSVMCDKAILAARQLTGSSAKHIAYYNDELEKRVAGEQVYAVRLFDAIRSGELTMMLQPVVSAEDDVVGAEALVRWIRQDGKVIMPDEFIGFFEETGLIYKMDQFIWKEAVKELKRWKDIGHPDWFISVNVTGGDLNQGDIFSILTALTDDYGVERKNLHLEIADLSEYKDKEKQKETVVRLREGGFTVWMDNFGSAYSSINLLKELQASAIKVDMLSIYDTEDMDRSEKIMNAVARIAESLDMDLIPERVSDEAMCQLAKRTGCKMYQGNYFDGAIRAEEFVKRYIL